MTRDEALLTRLGMEHVGWVDLRVSVRVEGGHPAYAVSGVDPATGIRGPWRSRYSDLCSDDALAPTSTREWLA